MNRGKFLKHYVEALRNMGRNAFVRHHKWPALIGLGMYEHLSNIRPRGRETLITQIETGEQVVESNSLVDRVWLIQKENTMAKDPGITVGKTFENDLTITEYSLSRTHCAFHLSKEGVTITDLNSLNGTLVNGERITPEEPVVLKDGAQITLGRFCFEFMSPRRFITRVDEVDSF